MRENEMEEKKAGNKIKRNENERETTENDEKGK